MLGQYGREGGPAKSEVRRPDRLATQVSVMLLRSDRSPITVHLILSCTKQQQQQLQRGEGTGVASLGIRLITKVVDLLPAPHVTTATTISIISLFLNELN